MRHHAQLVVAEVEAGRRQVAGAVAGRDVGNRRDAAADPARQHERQGAGAGERDAERRERRHDDGAQLMADVGERQRDADVGDRPDG